MNTSHLVVIFRFIPPSAILLFKHTQQQHTHFWRTTELFSFSQHYIMYIIRLSPEQLSHSVISVLLSISNWFHQFFQYAHKEMSIRGMKMVVWECRCRLSSSYQAAARNSRQGRLLKLKSHTKTTSSGSNYTSHPWLLSHSWRPWDPG